MDNALKLFVQTLFSMGSEFGIQALASHFDGPEPQRDTWGGGVCLGRQVDCVGRPGICRRNGLAF